jgi:hypothetical protein
VLKLLFIFLNFSLMCTFLFLSDSGVFPIVAGDAILRGERERDGILPIVQVFTCMTHVV